MRLDWLLVFFMGAWTADAGQSGPFPQLYGRPTLFCPPGNYAEGLTARIEADARQANNATSADDNATQVDYDDDALYVHCMPCDVDTYSDGTDAWGLEACHPCPEGTTAPLAGATACV